MNKPKKFSSYIAALLSGVCAYSEDWANSIFKSLFGLSSDDVSDCSHYLDYVIDSDNLIERKTCHKVENIDYGPFDFECSECGATVWKFNMDIGGQEVFGAPLFCPYCGAEVGEYHASTQE